MPTVDPSDSYADLIEVHHQEQLYNEEKGYTETAQQHRDAIGALMIAIGPG